MACNIRVIAGKTQPLKRDEYTKKGPTFQSQLTHEEIKERLSQYVPVDEPHLLQPGTHVRYFIEDKDGNWLFRMGGFVKMNTHADYLMLSTEPYGGKSWSVQKKTAKFFRRKATNDTTDKVKVESQYQAALEQQQQEIQRLRRELEQAVGRDRERSERTSTIGTSGTKTSTEVLRTRAQSAPQQMVKNLERSDKFERSVKPSEISNLQKGSGSSNAGMMRTSTSSNAGKSSFGKR
jgi:hypothetical protein